MKQHLPSEASALVVGQELNESCDKEYTRRLRICQLLAQTVVKQDTTSELVLQKRDDALHIEPNTNIEEARSELLCIQDKNEKEQQRQNRNDDDRQHDSEAPHVHADAMYSME